MGCPDLCIEWENKNPKTIFHFNKWFLRKVPKTSLKTRNLIIAYLLRFLGLFSGTRQQKEKWSSDYCFPTQYTSLDTPHDYVPRTFIFGPYIVIMKIFKILSNHLDMFHNVVMGLILFVVANATIYQMPMGRFYLLIFLSHPNVAPAAIPGAY